MSRIKTDQFISIPLEEEYLNLPLPEYLNELLQMSLAWLTDVLLMLICCALVANLILLALLLLFALEDSLINYFVIRKRSFTYLSHTLAISKHFTSSLLAASSNKLSALSNL